MFYYDDMSAARIAEILGISENTVYKRLERGRGILKLNMEMTAFAGLFLRSEAFITTALSP